MVKVFNIFHECYCIMNLKIDMSVTNSSPKGIISYDYVLFCAPIECSAALGMSGHEGT